MRVAVRDAVRRHQTACVFQRFQNDRDSFPNVLSAEQRKVGGIRAVALHRVQDVVVSQTMRHARIEVIHTVSRCAVHDTGAVCVGGVIGQIHRGSSLIGSIHMRQRMVKLNQIQRLAFASGYCFAAELPAL